MRACAQPRTRVHVRACMCCAYRAESAAARSSHLRSFQSPYAPVSARMYTQFGLRVSQPICSARAHARTHTHACTPCGTYTCGSVRSARPGPMVAPSRSNHPRRRASAPAHRPPAPAQARLHVHAHHRSVQIAQPRRPASAGPACTGNASQTTVARIMLTTYGTNDAMQPLVIALCRASRACASVRIDLALEHRSAEH